MTPKSSRLRTETGLSLIELLVAMMLLGVLITIVGGLFVSTTRSVALAQGISDNAKQASNGMNEVARVIRAGTDNPVDGQSLNDPAFVIASDEALILYAYINLDSAAQQPVMIRLSLNAGRQLVESRWPATALANGNWSFPTCSSATVCSSPAASTRVLAGVVAPSSGSSKLFTYLLSNGTALAVPTGGFSVTQRRTIAAVKVNLTVQASLTDATRSVTLQNTVGIPNLGLTQTGAIS